MSFYQHLKLFTKNDIIMHWREVVLGKNWLHACISKLCIVCPKILLPTHFDNFFLQNTHTFERNKVEIDKRE